MHQTLTKEHKLFSSSLEDLDDLAGEVLKFSEPVKILLFYGEMGAGKTTFIKALCKKMGVLDKVTSPTFSLVNHYINADNQNIYHFDFYRIKDESEAMDIGAEEYFNSGDYCLIEWPSLIPSLIPDEYVKVEINHNKDQRIFQLQKHEVPKKI